MIARLEPELTFSEGDTVRAYAEVYGLARRDGVIAYSASYSILRSDDPQRDIGLAEWPTASNLYFERVRQARSEAREVENIDIQPTRIPSGRYLLRLELRAPRGGALIGRVTTAFQVR